MNDSFTHLIKTWRKNKQFTQQVLAEEVGTTSRIISFLETGKEKPTRQMTERISKALELSYQAHFDLIQAAGFQPNKNEVMHQQYYQEVLAAANKMIKNHHPYPACVVDSNYNALAVNESIVNCFDYFIGVKFEHEWLPKSLFKVIYSPGSLGDTFEKRDECAKFMVQRLHRENLAKGKPLDLKTFAMEHPFFDEHVINYDADYIPSPELIMNMPVDGKDYETSSVIVTVGLPHDLGGDAIRVVLVYPYNDVASALFEQWRQQ